MHRKNSPKINRTFPFNQNKKCNAVSHIAFCLFSLAFDSAQLILKPNPRAGGEVAFRIGAAGELNHGFAVIGGAGNARVGFFLQFIHFAVKVIHAVFHIGDTMIQIINHARRDAARHIIHPITQLLELSIVHGVGSGRTVADILQFIAAKVNVGAVDNSYVGACAAAEGGIACCFQVFRIHRIRIHRIRIHRIRINSGCVHRGSGDAVDNDMAT